MESKLERHSELAVNLQWAADWHRVRQLGSAVRVAMARAAFRVWQRGQAQNEALDAHDAAQAEREATTAFKRWQDVEQATDVQNRAQPPSQQNTA